ncbi:MAG: zinc ribbon domain-containing protein [archaeon]
MFKRKCVSCARKVDRKFNFCPYCGESFKARREKDDFGMLGEDDFGDDVGIEQKLPFGMEKIMGSLVKQLEKQMGNMNFDGMPKGIRINIVRGRPQMRQVVREAPKKKREIVRISDEEGRRRMGLKKIEAESKVRRLADRIVYEIDAPGVRDKNDVVVTELATGLEIRVYSKDKCYVKLIPLKVELIEYYVRSEKVFVELRS